MGNGNARHFVVAVSLAGMLLSGCGGATAPDKLHDEAIAQCQADLDDQLGGEATYSDMTANGGDATPNDPSKYLYGVEGKVAGETLTKNVMCLAIYDSEAEAWEITASVY